MTTHLPLSTTPFSRSLYHAELLHFLFKILTRFAGSVPHGQLNHVWPEKMFSCEEAFFLSPPSIHILYPPVHRTDEETRKLDSAPSSKCTCQPPGFPIAHVPAITTHKALLGIKQRHFSPPRRLLYYPSEQIVARLMKIYLSPGMVREFVVNQSQFQRDELTPPMDPCAHFHSQN